MFARAGPEQKSWKNGLDAKVQMCIASFPREWQGDPSMAMYLRRTLQAIPLD